MTGEKTRFSHVAVTENVARDDCEASLVPENRLRSILKHAQDAGRKKD